ncbi:MAG TPA: TIGR02206 family membrane protein [Rectinemataceae bacterium]|nr:TIGR02206 family membrane protein [Rectinemataceae bacterium]
MERDKGEGAKRRARGLFLAVGLFGFIAMDIGLSLALTKPEGARIASPADEAKVGRVAEVAGDAWFEPGPAALASIRVEAEGPEGKSATATVDRVVVRDRGKVLLELSRWRGRIEFPLDGEWKIVAIATSASGAETRSLGRRINVGEVGRSAAFKTFGSDHWIPVVIILIVAISAAFLVRKKGGIPPRLAWKVSVLLWLNEFIYQPQWFAQGGWSAATALIVQMCGLTIIAIPFAFLLKEGPLRKRLVEIVWFWGIGGASQALLSPDLGAVGFPDFRYFSFFISHGLIIVSAAALVAEHPGRIDIKAFGRVLAITNLALLPVAALNRLIAMLPPHDPGNYFILSYPPPEGSPVDALAAIFGPAPRYVIGLEILAIAIFALLWAPFAIARRKSPRPRP